MNQSQILTAAEAATKAIDKAHTDLIDAIQAVAEVARDSIVANAEPHGCARGGGVLVSESDMTELREALNEWTRVGNVYMKLIQESAAT